MTERLNAMKRANKNFIIPNDGHLKERGHLAISEELLTALSDLPKVKRTAD